MQVAYCCYLHLHLLLSCCHLNSFNGITQVMPFPYVSMILCTVDDRSATDPLHRAWQYPLVTRAADQVVKKPAGNNFLEFRRINELKHQYFGEQDMPVRIHS